MNPSDILQVTLHDSIHTPVSGQIGPVLSSKPTALNKPVTFGLETVSGQLFLTVAGTSKQGKFKILVPFTQVKNVDVNPNATPALKAAK